MCKDTLNPTGKFRTYQMAIMWTLSVKLESFYHINFDCVLLCSGCNTVPFMYTVPIYPTDRLDELKRLIEEGWPDGEEPGNDVVSYLHLGLVRLSEMGLDKELAQRVFLPQNGCCAYCLNKEGSAVCKHCGVVNLCKKCRKQLYHQFVCGCFMDSGGIFDWKNVKWLN